MSLSPVSMEIPTASDHRRQLARAIGYGKWLIDARQAHWREGFDLDFGQLDLIVDMGGVAQRSFRVCDENGAKADLVKFSM
jgi:hypothetical protein